MSVGGLSVCSALGISMEMLIWKSYETVSYDIVLLQYRSGHLSMLVVVMLDEVLIAHARFLLHEYCGFDDFSKTCCVWIACLENHLRLIDGR